MIDMDKEERLLRVLETVVGLFNDALQPGDPTRLGANPRFLRFATDVRDIYGGDKTLMLLDVNR